MNQTSWLAYLWVLPASSISLFCGRRVEALSITAVSPGVSLLAGLALRVILCCRCAAGRLRCVASKQAPNDALCELW